MKDDKQPAFPIKISDASQFQWIDCGLTKREYFAGLAMQGILAGHDVLTAEGNIHPTLVAQEAVMNADALLTELRKEQSREQE